MSSASIEDFVSRKPLPESGICYVAPDVPIPSPRGSSVHVIEIARTLSSAGHEVHVICRRAKRDEPKVSELDGIVLHRLNRFIIFPGGKVSEVGRSASETRHGLMSWLYEMYLRYLFSFYASLVAARIIRKRKLEAIIERETSFGAGGLASIFTRKPMILEIVGPRYSRISVWKSKQILYYTESMLRKWVDKRKCLEVTGAVNASLFREDEQLRRRYREELGFSAEDQIIGYAGSFQDWHGIDALIASIEKLKNLYPNLRALLVGPYYEKYRLLSENLGLGEICVFTGPVPYERVPGYVNAADIMVALYEPEKNQMRKEYGIGSPLKILEYMACGKPVISTDVRPVDKILQNGYSGCLIKPGDQEALVQSISDLLNNPVKRNSIALHGRQAVEGKYSWRQLVATIEKILWT